MATPSTSAAAPATAGATAPRERKEEDKTGQKDMVEGDDVAPTAGVAGLSSAPAAATTAGGGLSLDEVTGTIKIVSKDKKEYDVERKNAFVSTLIKTSLDTDASATEVPIPGVQSNILTEVVAYMNHHKGVEPPIVEKPLRSKVMKDVCKDPWDADFVDRIGENRQALYDLILAANYMDIKSLLHLGCAKVASLIKGQPLEKIKDILSTGAPAAPAGAAGAATGGSAPARTEGKEEEKKAGK